MPTLDTLDTVIAIVVVLLVLSLIVQAIQSFIKKIFRLKSREIERSLADLFEHVIDKAATPTTPTPAAGSTPTKTDAGAKAGPAVPESAAGKLIDTVLGEFKKVGRYTRRGRLVLDSISKEDLLKILARVDSKHFYADYVTKFQAMYTDIQALEREIERLITNDPPLLQGAASARFAEMQAVMSPLINDVKNILSGNAVKTDALLGDLINVRRVKLDDALRLLAAAQESIAADLKEARSANNTVTAASLQKLSASLTTIAGIVGQLSQRMDAAFAVLRTKLAHVEMWYDTVMQGFEERYTRQMKNVALYISLAVVVFLNASFFRIYHNIATNDLQRALILQEGEQQLADKTQPSPDNVNVNRGYNAGGNVNASRAAVNNPGDNYNSNTSGTINVNSTPTPVVTPTPAPTPPEPDVTAKEINEQREVIEDYVETYEGFGFSPLTWQQVKTWGNRFVTNPFSNEWMADRRQDFTTLLGWSVMVLLLSVGAPFWQDTLESIFGVKNLLRKKSDTQNVEKESGAGQTKQ